jgi:hypothetical protein
MNRLKACSGRNLRAGREPGINGNDDRTTTDLCGRFLLIDAVTSGALAKGWGGRFCLPGKRGRSRADRVICAEGLPYEGKFRLRRSPDRLPFSQPFCHMPTRPSDCFNPVGKSRWSEEPTFSLIQDFGSLSGSPASLHARTREKHSAGGTNGFREGFSAFPN